MSSYPDGTFQVEAEATLFGFDPAPTLATITARSRGWRAGGAAVTMVVALLVAPAVAVIPPHAVWFLGALAAGGFMARLRYIERFTLQGVEGSCPKCGAALHVKAGRLKVPHPLPCDACHHEATLRLPAGALAAHAEA